jgi:hypothetical protein
MSENEIIFNKTAKTLMSNWDIDGFKKEFPTLFHVIILSMIQKEHLSIRKNK